MNGQDRPVGREAARLDEASRRRAENALRDRGFADRFTDGRYSQARPKFGRPKDDRRVSGPVRVLPPEERAAVWASRGTPTKAHTTESSTARPRKSTDRSSRPPRQRLVATVGRPTTVFSFQFLVNKSFMSQRDHPITFRNWSYDQLVGVIGVIDHASQPVRVVNCFGIEMDGRIRHSTTNGQHYYQLNSKDPEITGGLTKGDVIRVELIDRSGRPEVRLHST